MHGGVKIYNRSPAAARAYVESDRSRVDDYYLAEGSGIARRFGATPGEGVIDLGVLDGDGYEQWVAGFDPVSGQARDRRRENGNPVRFVEITVNGPKTWSLAAALNPEVAAAYDAAQDRAAEQVIGWVAEHATTRAGPRGRQVQVPVEELEAVTVRHYTSRAGDPHRHLHLQVNARVFAVGQWRGLHTVGFRDSIEALNGIGHAAVMCDPEFRAALAGAGFTLDPDVRGDRRAGAVRGGVQCAGRADRAEHRPLRGRMAHREPRPGTRPDGPSVVGPTGLEGRPPRQDRPARRRRTRGARGTSSWPTSATRTRPRSPGCRSSSAHRGWVSSTATPRSETILVRLGARRSAWNAADIRGQAEKVIAAAGLVLDPAVRIELAEDLTARAVEACVPLLRHPDVPEHIRSLTSRHVLSTRGRHRGPARRPRQRPGDPGGAVPRRAGTGLDEHQRTAVAALAGDAGLVVVEGAAGAGKTTTLAATQTAAGRAGPADAGGDPDLEGRPGRRPRGRHRRARWRGWSTSTATAGTPTAAGPALPPSRRPRRCWGVVTCCWSMRPGCWTRTPPARSSPWPTRWAPGSPGG